MTLKADYMWSKVAIRLNGTRSIPYEQLQC